MKTSDEKTGWNPSYSISSLLLQVQNFISDPDMGDHIPDDYLIQQLMKSMDTYTKTFTVYKKPQTPLSLVIKGKGASGTVIATTKLSDTDLQECEYYLVFGYLDANGIMHDFASQLQTNPGEVRWSKQMPADIVNNSSNTLYVYAL